MSGGETPTALCVDDDARVRALVAELLGARGYAVEGRATVASAIAAMGLPIALAVVDLGLPDGSGVDVLRALARRRPGARAVVLTVDDRPAQVLEALRAGASGYVLKEDLHARLGAAVDEARCGGVALSTGPAAALLQHLRAGDDAGPLEVSLTAAERAVLEGLARGLSYEQCALAGAVSINTVRTHVRAAYRKLEVSTKTEAVLAALRRGLIAPP